MLAGRSQKMIFAARGGYAAKGVSAALPIENEIRPTERNLQIGAGLFESCGVYASCLPPAAARNRSTSDKMDLLLSVVTVSVYVPERSVLGRLGVDLERMRTVAGYGDLLDLVDIAVSGGLQLHSSRQHRKTRKNRQRSALRQCFTDSRQGSHRDIVEPDTAFADCSQEAVTFLWGRR